VFGEQGHPVRATISDMGPLLLGRMLNLNETQMGVLNLVFKIADDNGLLLLDLKDLRAMLQYVGDNAKQFTTEYGNISAASMGAIQRGLLQIEPGRRQVLRRAHAQHQRPDADRRQRHGRGQHAGGRQADERAAPVRHLPAVAAVRAVRAAAGNRRPEKPKLVFFFDEAHLLFNDAPKVLVERIELVVRLVRSKGVGVYFVTQNPLDVPDSVLGQLGNRVQHACAPSPRATRRPSWPRRHTMRPNPAWTSPPPSPSWPWARPWSASSTKRPPQRDRARVRDPARQPDRPDHHGRAAQGADRWLLVAGVYEKAVDRESAFEILRDRTASATPAKPGDAPAAAGAAGSTQQASATDSMMDGLKELLFGRTGPRGGQHDGLVQTMAKSTVRTVGNSLGKEILRGVLGGILGNKKR
jgi:hypothetical protein